MKCSKCGQQIPNGFLRCPCGGEGVNTRPWSTGAFIKSRLTPLTLVTGMKAYLGLSN